MLGVGDPACPHRSEDELVDPTCSELWSPLAQSGAQWGAGRTQDSNVLYTPRPGLSRPESADIFSAPFSPENFFIYHPEPWLCALEEWGFSRIVASSQGRESGQWLSLGLLCDLGQLVYLWEFQSDVGEWCTTQG